MNWTGGSADVKSQLSGAETADPDAGIGKDADAFHPRSGVRLDLYREDVASRLNAADLEEVAVANLERARSRALFDATVEQVDAAPVDDAALRRSLDRELVLDRGAAVGFHAHVCETGVTSGGKRDPKVQVGEVPRLGSLPGAGR